MQPKHTVKKLKYQTTLYVDTFHLPVQCTMISHLNLYFYKLSEEGCSKWIVSSGTET